MNSKLRKLMLRDCSGEVESIDIYFMADLFWT